MSSNRGIGGFNFDKFYDPRLKDVKKPALSKGFRGMQFPFFPKEDPNKSSESLRTRLDSSNSENEQFTSTSPRLERPIPTKSPYYSWGLNSLLSQMSYMNTNRVANKFDFNLAKTNRKGIVDILKPSFVPNPVNFKPTKIYDKFDISDIDESKLISIQNLANEEQLQEIDDSYENSAESELSAESAEIPGIESPAFMALVKATKQVQSMDEDRNLKEASSPASSGLVEKKFTNNFWLNNSQNGMIGLLSHQEREAKVKRYLEKKKRRKQLVENIVRYECRKDLADRRYRFQGRFVKLEDLKRLEKDYIFDSNSKKLIKPIFKTQKVLSRYRSGSHISNLNSEGDVSMEVSDN
jgi:hypothetical protein